MTPQAARKNAPRSNAGVIDFDKLLFKRSTKPITIRLGGREFTLRRDLSSEEVIAYWSIVDKGPAHDVEAWTILAGETDAPELDRMFKAMPSEIGRYAAAKIFDAVGLMTQPPKEDDDGESEEGDAGES